MTDCHDVQATIAAVAAAWAANDADAFVAGYAADATATLPGTFLGSREEIRASMAESFATVLKGSAPEHEVLAVRFPRQGTAVVNTTLAIRFAGQDAADEATRTRDTWTLHQEGERWLIDAYHASAAAG